MGRGSAEDCVAPPPLCSPLAFSFLAGGSCSCAGSCLLSSRSLLSPDPKFPEEGPHSLFLQEGHLQALQVQEQRSCRSRLPGRKRQVASRREEEPRSHQQGPPAPPGSGPALGELLSTQADTEAPAPLFGSQERRSPSQGKSQAPDSTQVDQGLGPSLCPKPQEAPCPLRPSKPGSSKPFT